MSRILVVGELNADLVMTGLPSLPVLGRELLATGFRMAMGSSSAITAARLAALGAPTDFVGRVGGDDLGRFVTHALRQFGVGVAHLQVVPDAQTDVTIALTYEHDRALLTYPGLMTTFDGASISPELLANYDHLHAGSFALQTALQPELPRLFRMAHQGGLTTSLDTGWDPHEQWMNNPHLGPTLAEADFFFPNESEAIAIGGEWNPQKLAALVRGTLAIKLGAKGGLAIRAGSAPVTVPAFPVDVVDTTGAGDAFNAGFLYATLMAKSDLAGALRFAVACGAEAVTHVGGPTDAPSAQAVREWLKARYNVKA